MKTSAVIVTYNKKEELKKSLDAMFNLDENIYKIIVINNNSTDGTDKYLESINDERIIYKNLEENLGGAGGFSKGIKVAYEETDSDYFWIMDDDATPNSDALNVLVDTAQKLNDKFGFLSSNVVFENGQGTNCPKAADDWNIDLNKLGLIKVKTGTFVSLLVKRSTVKEVGLPIGEMFIWGDDNEYTGRINQSSSYGSYFVMNSTVIHRSRPFDIDILTCPMKILNRYNYLFRNLIYTDLHVLSFKDFIIEIMKNIYICLLILFRSKDHKIKRIFTVLSGTFKGFFFAPKVQFPRDTIGK